MRTVGCWVLGASALVLGAPAALSIHAQAPSTRHALPPSAEAAYRGIAPRVDGAEAMNVVRFMDQYWRLAGNPGFDASIDYIASKLKSPSITVTQMTFPSRSRGWDYQTGTVAFADDGEVVLSREHDRVSLCINSFSTPDGGLVAPLVDVGSGASSDYDGKEIKGAIVLGSVDVGRLWRDAVVNRGAIGVISTAVADYIRPKGTETLSPQQQDVFQWGGIPYDEARKGFGFKASWRAASRLRERLARGGVSLKVTIRSAFYDTPSRAVVAEIRGATKPDERIVLVAHVQEPGANDDASGCGTLLALVKALSKAIDAGALPRPGRTLTFIWGDEIADSREWLKDQAQGVQYMLSMDMTGEDTAKTGGSFLIEKQPDPSAVWPDPADPHTAWGSSAVKAESLKGSLLNDVHLAICRRRSQDTGWVVKTNPYEGGSDHTVFGDAGIPSLLNWHFTDRYYHTNQDRPDKTSIPEMVNVGSAVGTSAWFLGSANEQDAMATIDLIASAAEARLTLERREGADAKVIAAWKKWYAEALDSVRRLSVSGTSPAIDARVKAAQAALN